MIQIQPILLGITQQNGTNLIVQPIINNTQDKTCSLNWRVLSDDFKDLAIGTINLTEEQYNGWLGENEYVENIVIETLKLNRL
jgi:hypothetical protein